MNHHKERSNEMFFSALVARYLITDNSIMFSISSFHYVSHTHKKEKNNEVRELCTLCL